MRSTFIPGTEIQVSAFCLGLADAGVRTSKEDALKHMDHFAERGGTFFDSAHIYAFWGPEGAGSSERILGHWLKTRGRGAAFFGTKGGHSPIGVESYPRRDDFLAMDVMEQDLSESLDRLGLDSVDLYYYHRDDPRVSVEVLVDQMDSFARRGFIRLAGASNWLPERVAAANAYADRSGKIRFSVVQNQWSLARPKWKAPGPGDVVATSSAHVEEFGRLGVLLAPWSPSAAGFFGGKDPWGGDYDTPENQAVREKAEQIGKAAGASATTVALAWLLAQGLPISPILGTWSAAHLEEALAAESLAVDLSGLQQP